MTAAAAVDGSGVDRDRAIRLFTYLRELTEVRSPVVRDCDTYDKRLWLSDIPREPECRCAAWTGDDDVPWLSIERPKMAAPPQPPAPLRHWLDLAAIDQSSGSGPTLKETAVQLDPGPGGPVTKVLHLREHPSVRAAWENYMGRDWRPWAQEHRRLQRVQVVYNSLFEIYQQQQRFGESYEVVLGQDCSFGSPTPTSEFGGT